MRCRIPVCLFVLVAVGSLPVAAQADPRIHELIQGGEFEEAQERLERRIARDRRPNQANDRGQTTLHVAAMAGHIDALAVLIDYGISIDLRNAESNTPLILAIDALQPAVVEWLLARGANVEVRDELGRTPLMFAAGTGRLEFVDALLESGADAAAVDPVGSDALMYAVHSRLADGPVYDRLLDSGADPRAVDARGLSAMYMARANGDSVLVEMLGARGVDMPLADFWFERKQIRDDGIYFGVQFEEPDGQCQDRRFLSISSEVPVASRVGGRWTWNDGLDCHVEFDDGRITCQLESACRSRSADEAYQRYALETGSGDSDPAADRAILFADPRNTNVLLRFAEDPVDRGAAMLVPSGTVEFRVDLSLYAREFRNMGPPQSMLSSGLSSNPAIAIGSGYSVLSVFQSFGSTELPLVEAHPVQFEAESGRAYKVLLRTYRDPAAGADFYDIWVVDFASSEIVFESRANALLVP